MSETIKCKSNWKGMNKVIENFIRQHEICQKAKVRWKKPKFCINHNNNTKKPFERLKINILEICPQNYVFNSRNQLIKFIKPM